MALLSHEGGGISSVTHGLAAGLAKKKAEVTIFTTTTSNVQNIAEIPGHYTVVSLPMVDLPPRSLWFHLRNSNILSNMLEDYDVVHAVSPEMAIPFVSFKKLKKPLITTVHGSHRATLRAFALSPVKNWTLSDFTLNVLELPLHEITSRRCFDRSDMIAVCSHSTLAEIRELEKVDVSRAEVIHNGIDFREIDNGAGNVVRKREDEEKLTIIYAGRLYWMKGVFLLLDAFMKIKKEIGNVQLRIFGRGPLERKLKRFIANAKLEREVLLGGFIPHARLIEEIRRSDLAVFPSIYESQPVFVLETMACKKTILTFDLPYAREIVRNQHTGMLARAYDVEDLAARAEEALRNDDLRLRIGQNAYDYVRRKHDWDKQAEKYLALYEKGIDSYRLNRLSF